jgi:WD40 repeat protein
MALVLLAGGASRGEGARTPRTDRYGDPLPPGAVARLGTVRLRHAGAEVTFSADGKHLISCGRFDREVRVWDATSGGLVRRRRLTWPMPGDESPWELALSPGGATVAVPYEKAVYLYDTTTGAERSRLRIEGWLLTFSPDGKILAVVNKSDVVDCAQIQLWDVARGKIGRVLNIPDLFDPSAIAFAPDGKRLAVIDKYKPEMDEEGGTVHLWDVATGQRIGKDEKRMAQGESLVSLTFSPDGKTLAVGLRDGEVRLLDAATRKEKARLPVPRDVRIRSIERLTFSPDGRFLAGACDEALWGRGVLLWDVTGAKKLHRLLGWNSTGRFAFSPDSKTLVYHTDGNAIRLWDLASDRRRLPCGHDVPVEALAVSPDGKGIASAGKDAVYLWDTASGELLRSWEEGDAGTHACLFSSDGKRLICAGEDYAVLVRDRAGGKEVRRLVVDFLEGEGGVRFHALGLSADGKRLTAVATVGEKSGGLGVWDLETGKQLRHVPYKLQERIVNLSRGRREMRGFAHAALAPGAEVVSVWRDGRVALEEVATGRLLATLPEGVGEPYQRGRLHRGPALVFSPDGRRLTAAIMQPQEDPGDGDQCKGLSLIEAATGEEIFRREIGPFDHVAFTPDGRGVIVTDRTCLRVLDATTGERLHQTEWPPDVRNLRGEAAVCSLAVLPGDRLATGFADGDVLVWDLAPSTWPVHKPAHDLGRQELDALWADLAGSAPKAHRAIATLAVAPAQTVPFLRDRLQPAAAVDGKRIEQLLADLDGDDYAAREAASRQLAALRDCVEPALRRALRAEPSPEKRRRLQALLAAPPRPSAERLRTLRAIDVLERIATPEARRLLEKLGGGAAVRETREAQAALQRLKRR